MIIIDEMVYLFNKTIKNILSSYILHEKNTFDDKDPLGLAAKSKGEQYK